MQRWLVYAICFFIILGFISPIQGQFQPSIDSHFLIVGLQRAESLIVSGKGEVHFQMVRYKQSDSAIFAFSKKRSTWIINSDSTKERDAYTMGRLNLQSLKTQKTLTRLVASF